MASKKLSSVDFDVVIIGAGISGINAAYRIQQSFPNLNYTIVEARDQMGGTWDLFKYPGIRSDSDLHTFGFAWRPWTDPKTIADGIKIKEYIEECCAETGIDKKIRYRNKVLRADWSSKEQEWTLTLDVNGKETTLTTKWTLFGTGYYNYHEPLEVDIPGIENFKGQLIHPQFWPEDFNCKGKEVAIIGSGATAVTLLPNLSKDASHVTMVQRSPGYVISLPLVDPVGTFAHKVLPRSLAFKVVRLKFLLIPFLFFKFCMRQPAIAKKYVIDQAAKRLPAGTKMDPDFTPRYGPWQQRLCASPGGDYYACMKEGKASVATGIIEKITGDSIYMKETGTVLKPDIIIQATGLKLQFAGGTKVSVDGIPIVAHEKFTWRAGLIEDLPNAANFLGYTNASWTLGADTTAKLICRILKKMEKQNYSVVVPRVDPNIPMESRSSLNLTSTYIERAKGAGLPKSGNRGPWQARTNYFMDLWRAVFGSIDDGLEYIRPVA